MIKQKVHQIEQLPPAEQIPLTDLREVTLSEQRDALETQQIKEVQDRRTGTVQSRLGNAALGAFDAYLAVVSVENVLQPPALDMNGVRDLITTYFLYRFSKGAFYRGKAAVTGKGDPALDIGGGVLHPGRRKQILHDKKQEHIEDHRIDTFLRDRDLRKRPDLRKTSIGPVSS